ncbi:uncharacterized protein LOC109838046 isoform X3 [Asparagus officinalis]|uniref:uncharacterized protein LOC109838046 isoform X3 n=1 Tax=Asparagus officinalis TaxID=4686 RepID=UPI00098E62CD|nr:uncharacterized protein LOC109838046 isoform X3 [Asparagus officinalis]
MQLGGMALFSSATLLMMDDVDGDEIKFSDWEVLEIIQRMEDNQNVSILLFHEDIADYLLIRIINMAAQIGGLVTSISHLISQEEINLPISQPRHGNTDLGLQYLKSKMDSNPRDFRRIYRMPLNYFMKLCMVLRERGHLQDTRYISVEKMVAIFLLTVTQNQRYCITTERFDRSRFAVSVCFNKALQTLVSLAPCRMAPPPTEPPEKVTSESRFWPYFKDCIGAIDETHIPCMVYSEDQTPYRNRHGYLS